MKNRCKWCENSFDQYVRYHDEEWGAPVHDDQTHFEFLTLESAQAGLSWSTILRKRDGYREAFADFEVREVARFNEHKIQQLLNNSAIVRNELKIRSAVNNAQRFIEVQEAFGSFDHYIWSFVDGEPIQNHWDHHENIPATTPVSDQFSSDLKQRGFKFIGSTTMYAHWEANGLLNGPLGCCFRHAEYKKIA